MKLSFLACFQVVSNKEEEGPHLHTKTPRYATIVANQDTLHDFASRPRTTTRRRIMPTKPRTMMTMPLQQRMEIIARPYVLKMLKTIGSEERLLIQKPRDHTSM